ncbi:MAG: heavy metal-binding domain-containing protein [Deltaproteobacteria bacterium]|nr:heavy metal-binding domain-containing protein [Deltaproteobacteria bacterium]
MEAIISLVIQLGIPLLIIVVALIVGSALERRHYRSIDERERRYGGIPLINEKKYPTLQPVAEARFVTGSVVISYDYFKRFLAGLRMIFGGEVKSYVSLLDRGRREAILRMKEKCPDADLIVNVRLETSSISKGGSKQRLGAVEVFAYGTALRYVAGER